MQATRVTGSRAAWRSFVQGFGCAALAILSGLARPDAAHAQTLSFIRDTEIEALLNDYSRPIFRAAGLGTQNITMRVVKHETFNAFVLDGQNVFVHTGALMQSDTPNQVIGVIAHETGHIVGGHLAQLRDRIARDQTKSLLIKLLGIGLMVAGGGNSGVSGAGTGVLVGGDQLIINSLMADRRAQESAADQSGLRFLEATKQSGQGMLETFERFAQQEYVSASGATQDAFARSHPVAANRLAQLRERVAASPFAHQKDAPQLQLRHDLMRAKLAGYLERPQIVVNRYRQDDSLPARYARTIATFFSRGIEASVPQADALIREQPKNPYFHELKADFLMRSGRAHEAIPELRTALKLAGDAPLIAVRLAEALDGENDARSTAESIALARKSLVTDKNPRGYRLLASGYAKQGRVPEADLAIAEAHFLEGNIKQAQIFAKRSQRGLKVGSPEGLRAGDIVSYKLPKGAL